MGATSGPVNVDSFSSEVESVFRKISQIQPNLLVTAADDGLFYLQSSCAIVIIFVSNRTFFQISAVFRCLPNYKWTREKLRLLF
jgi:hypothetical protein